MLAGLSAVPLHARRRKGCRSLNLARSSNEFFIRRVTLFGPVCTRAGRRWKRRRKENVLKCNCTAGLSLRAANQEKMNVLLSGTTECGLNVKYFVVFREVCNF